MALGNLLGMVGAGLAKAATDYATKKKTTPTTTPTNKTTSQPTYNEHQQYIQDTFTGGYDDYKRIQQDRYNTAYTTGDYDLLQRLDKDAQRVGYNLSIPQQQIMPQQITPQTDNSQMLNDILSAVKTYESQIPDMPYPDMGDYKFDNIQKQLGDLTNQVKNYQGADYMNMDEAIARANSQLGGMYNESMNKAIENYNKNAIARGMYGQMPVEALKQNAIAENELNKSNAVNSFGADLYSKDFNMAQQKNNNYYAQINRLADLLGQQYNTELDQYQGDLNRYNTMYNRARQADSDYFDNIYRQLDILGTQQNMQNNEMDKYANNIGQFSNDYMAEINRVKGDNDPSNDWQIAYLQNARNQKISGQNTAQSEAQSTQYKQAMDMFSKLGYASGWVAQALGLPEGTTTASYSNSLRSKSGGSGGGTNTPSEPKGIELSPAQMNSYMEMAANDLINRKGEGYSPTRDEIFAETAKLLKALGYDSSAIDRYLKSLPRDIPSRSKDTNAPTLLDILSMNGMLNGNNNYSTQYDYDLFNFLNE